MTKKSHLTTSEVAHQLGVSEQSVYLLVKKGELEPLNAKDWAIDGHYYFDADQVALLAEKRKKPGLSTGDIAKRLNVTQSTVIRYIKQNRLRAQPLEYRGRIGYFVSEDDFESFLAEYQQNVKRDVRSFSKGIHGYLLYQSFISPNGQVTRLMDVKDGILQTETGDKLSLEEALKNLFISEGMLSFDSPNRTSFYRRFMM
jgi:transposase